MGEPLRAYEVTLPKDSPIGHCTFKSCLFTRGVTKTLHLREREARSAAEGWFNVRAVSEVVKHQAKGALAAIEKSRDKEGKLTPKAAEKAVQALDPIVELCAQAHLELPTGIVKLVDEAHQVLAVAETEKKE